MLHARISEFVSLVDCHSQKVKLEKSGFHKGIVSCDLLRLLPWLLGLGPLAHMKETVFLDQGLVKRLAKDKARMTKWRTEWLARMILDDGGCIDFENGPCSDQNCALKLCPVVYTKISKLLGLSAILSSVCHWLRTVPGTIIK